MYFSRPHRHGHGRPCPLLPAIVRGARVLYATPRQTCPRPRPRAQIAFKDSMIHGILQFTLSIAFRYVLHRNESRDIRCRESFLLTLPANPEPPWQGVRKAHDNLHDAQGTQGGRGRGHIQERTFHTCTQPTVRGEIVWDKQRPSPNPEGPSPRRELHRTAERTRVANPTACTAFRPPDRRSLANFPLGERRQTGGKSRRH